MNEEKKGAPTSNNLFNLPDDTLTKISGFSDFTAIAKTSKRGREISLLQDASYYVPKLGLDVKQANHVNLLAEITGLKTAAIREGHYSPQATRQLHLLCQILPAFKDNYDCWRPINPSLHRQSRWILRRMRKDMSQRGRPIPYEPYSFPFLNYFQNNTSFTSKKLKAQRALLQACQKDPNIAAKVVQINLFRQRMQTPSLFSKLKGALLGALFGLIGILLLYFTYGLMPLLFSTLPSLLADILKYQLLSQPSWLPLIKALVIDVWLGIVVFTAVIFFIDAFCRNPGNERSFSQRLAKLLKPLLAAIILPVTILIFIAHCIYLGYKIGYNALYTQVNLRTSTLLKRILNAFFFGSFSSSKQFSEIFEIGKSIPQLAEEYNKSNPQPRDQLVIAIPSNNPTHVAVSTSLTANSVESAGETDSLLTRTGSVGSGHIEIELTTPDSSLRQRPVVTTVGRNNSFFSSTALAQSDTADPTDITSAAPP